MERNKRANFMNTKHLEQKLREKERELQSDLARFESEAQLAGDREVRDPTDDATASQGTSEAFEEGTIVSQTLEQVQDALHRLEDGTYGTCLVCGRPIEPARLEALPWAANCLEDQEKQDARGAIHEGSTL
jgi:DnaK suppressor protein